MKSRVRLLIGLVVLGAMVAPLAQASELTQFNLKTCNEDRSRCVQVECPMVAESSSGQIWVGQDAKVKLTGKGIGRVWPSARVVIDLQREQLVIEERKDSKLVETVISLNVLTVKRNEIFL